MNKSDFAKERMTTLMSLVLAVVARVPMKVEKSAANLYSHKLTGGLLMVVGIILTFVTIVKVT